MTNANITTFNLNNLKPGETIDITDKFADQDVSNVKVLWTKLEGQGETVLAQINKSMEIFLPGDKKIIGILDTRSMNGIIPATSIPSLEKSFQSYNIAHGYHQIAIVNNQRLNDFVNVMQKIGNVLFPNHYVTYLVTDEESALKKVVEILEIKPEPS